MKPYRLKAKPIIAALTISSIIIFSLVLLLEKATTFEYIIKGIVHAGLFVFLFSILWFFLNKKGWQLKWVQKFRHFFDFPPDINGRYMGKIIRDGEMPQPFVIEVMQTLTNIVITTYCSQSTTESYVAEIAINETTQKFYLCFFWQGTYKQNSHSKQKENNFKGYTILQIDDGNPLKRIRGEFFSNKKKNAKGYVDVKWESNKPKGQF